MTDLISRAALLAHFRKQRDEFFNKFATQEGQPSRKFTVDFDDELDQCDQRISLIESFPAVEPIAKLVNNNQVGCLNIIETAPNVTIDIGTPLYVGGANAPGPLSKGAEFAAWWSRGLPRT